MLGVMQTREFLKRKKGCHNDGISESVPFFCCTAELHKSINMYSHNQANISMGYVYWCGPGKIDKLHRRKIFLNKATWGWWEQQKLDQGG